MQLYSKTLLQTSILGEINIFQNGISRLFVMCLQNGMRCLFWSVNCLWARFVYWCLINIFQDGRFWFISWFYPSILTFISFSQHGLPNLKCSEEDCLADFVLQRDLRMKYPGACSLEFQSVMQILTKCMLRWDTKTQSSKGKGILGAVLAFSVADEEQGRKTLHQHWQIWVQELNQTLRDCLFDTDATKRKKCTKNILPTYWQCY